MSNSPRSFDVWPSGGTPLVKEVSSPHFLPVTGEILAEITRRIVAELDPEQVILFGSYAYGTPHGDSDVDLLVIADTGLEAAQAAVTASRLIMPRPFPVDILVKTPAEVKRALQQHDSFIEEIMANGRVLYERPQ